MTASLSVCWCLSCAVGDASFKNEDLYAIAGLLKLFLVSVA